MDYLKICFLFLCLVAGRFSEKVHFNGDKVFRITPRTEDEVKFVHEWIEKLADRLDVWKEPSYVGAAIDVHVPVRDVDEVKETLAKAGVKYEVIIEDLEKLIEKEERENQQNAFSSSFFYAFQTYEKIIAEVKRFASVHSNAELKHLGLSYNRKDLLAIKVTEPNSFRPKPVIWVDGAIHPREWISPATVMYLLKQLLEPDREFQSLVRDALRKYDFYILPVFNPDGYVYTHKYDRMWRKTRSTNRNSRCIGVDPNRNWDANFGGPGTSSNPCKDIYRGTHAFSEIEVKTVSDSLKRLAYSVGLKSYWNVHAYSQLLLTPYGYTTRYPRDYAEIKRVGDIFAAGVREKSGKDFQVGPPSRILYSVGGGSMDWTYDKLGVKYSYGPELRPSRYSRGGFIISPWEIIPSGKEFTNGFLKAVLAMQ